MRRKSFAPSKKSKNRKSPRLRTELGSRWKSRLITEDLEQRNMLTVTNFQEGVGGYVGTQDAILYSQEPNANFETETGMSVDQQDVGGVRQGLLRFDSIIGPAAIPLGATINSATLTVEVFNDSNSSMLMSMYRMKSDWNQATATWNSFGAIGGVQASENEVEGLPPDAILFDASVGTHTFDVTTSLRHWASGASNFGWLFESAATNGWDFNTSEAALADRPRLSVDWTAPAGAGTFRFINLTPVHTEGDAGSSNAQLTIARVGGLTGPVSVDYTIAAGAGATAGVDFTAAGPITVNFAANQAFATIPVTIFGDTFLEGTEKVNVTLSGATGGAAIDGTANVASLSIADDDALINEVVANLGVDETNREYIELLGTPGASLNGYYFVVFESEEEENGGTGSGRADLVIDLTGQTFGANGLLVITPTAWAYTPGAGTNQFATAALNGAGGILEDSSQTYALVRSTITAIVQGTDYDTVGAYENATAVAIGNGLGILDQAPFTTTADIVDIVGVVEGGGGDRDRMATLQYPGVHVHQPDGPGGNTTSDAVTRLLGAKTPSSPGVWYNGEVPSGTIPAQYAWNTTQSSVVMPDGAQITPGKPNLLTTISFAVTSVVVDENAGTVTLTVNRSGDSTVAADVNYITVNGTATSGVGNDYTHEAGLVHFAIGDNSEDIVIDILPDPNAEGFETFSVQLSNATSPFVIITPSALVTITDADVLQANFQEGFAGYASTSDSTLSAFQPTLNFGTNNFVVVDEETGTQTGANARPSQALLRFEDIVGAGLGQVPSGSQVFGGFLTLNVTSATAPGAKIRLFRMLQPWGESSATFEDPQGTAGSSILNGVLPDDVESTAIADTIVPAPGVQGAVQIPLNRDTLQAWVNGAIPNHGWSIVGDDGNDWSFVSSDNVATPALVPKLTILYTAPGGQGTFGFARTDTRQNETGSASVQVLRSGGTSGSVVIDYTITNGTGTLADITGPTAGQITFDPGELFETITIPINADTDLERDETLNLTLSGVGVSFDRPAATLTIRDNDFNVGSPSLLLNEFFINSPGNDGGHEYIELKGTANSGMGSLYAVVLDGDVGIFEGTADLVAELGGSLNGSSGFTVVKAQDTFGFALPAGTTAIGRADLNTENLANDTATYALIYSPDTSFSAEAYDYDWNNDGTLELPSGIVFVDTITVNDGGVADRSYGPIGTTISHAAYVADAISRFRGNTTVNSAAAWFDGDLIANGDDPAVYDVSPFSTGLPSPGAALTPGEINVGTTVESPLVSLTSIVPNLPVGTVTLTFNGPVSQVLGSAGTPGVTITDTNGVIIATVNPIPNVGGLFTNTLTLSFTGSGVIGGQLPVGSYQLNFFGNSLVGNGRAVDSANNATATGSNFEFEFTQNAAANSSIVNRQLFYNNSAWDGNTLGVSTSDALAIATDKVAYLPGGGAMVNPGNAASPNSFKHVTSYSRGINGIFIDIQGPHAASLTAADFEFRINTGTNNSPSTWALAPNPSTITILPNTPAIGTDRIEIIWPNNSIRNNWLAVYVKANANTGLANNPGGKYGAGNGDLFFFGNRIGDAWVADSGSFSTGINDETATHVSGTGSAAITNRFDFDRNKAVGVNDETLAHLSGGVLNYINIGIPPLAPPPAPPADGGGDGDAGISSALAGVAGASDTGASSRAAVSRRPATGESEHPQHKALARLFDYFESREARGIKSSPRAEWISDALDLDDLLLDCLAEARSGGRRKSG